MSHRVGVCQSCRARFQIPASFSPNRAKCRTCGGVVEIGSPQGAPGRGPDRPPDRAPGAAPAPPRRAPQPVLEKPAAIPERAAPVAPAPAPAPKPQPVTAEPVIAAPARKRGLVRALLVAGIAAVVAIGLWSLFA